MLAQRSRYEALKVAVLHENEVRKTKLLTANETLKAKVVETKKAFEDLLKQFRQFEFKKGSEERTRAKHFYTASLARSRPSQLRESLWHPALSQSEGGTAIATGTFQPASWRFSPTRSRYREGKGIRVY